MIGPAIYSLLSADSRVTAFFGSNPLRVYPYGSAPQGTQAPYAVWRIVGGTPENSLGDIPTEDTISIQFDVFATSEATANNATQAIRDVIEQSMYVISWNDQGKDFQTNLFVFGFTCEGVFTRE
jgi:hypothetical protein